MSTFVYAQIAQQKHNAAQQAKSAQAASVPAGHNDIRMLSASAESRTATETTKTAATQKTVGQYVDALAGLIPTEVLTLHALVLSATTHIVNPKKDTNGTDTASASVAQSGNVGSDITPAANATQSANGGSDTSIGNMMDDATITLISAPDTLSAAFWGLIALSVLLYLVPRGHSAWKYSTTPLSGWHWYRAISVVDWVRATIPPLSFVAWTMMQRATAFDAAFPDMSQANRTVFGLFLAVMVLAVAASVAFEPVEETDSGGNDSDGKDKAGVLPNDPNDTDTPEDAPSLDNQQDQISDDSKPTPSPTPQTPTT